MKKQTNKKDKKYIVWNARTTDDKLVDISRTWVCSGSYHRPRWTRRARGPCSATSPLGSRWTLQVQENIIILTFDIQNIKTRILYMFNTDASMMLWGSCFKLCLKNIMHAVILIFHDFNHIHIICEGQKKHSGPLV